LKKEYIMRLILILKSELNSKNKITAIRELMLCKTDNKQHCYFSITGWMNHNLELEN